MSNRHSLEGDRNVFIRFFHYLWKRDKDLNSARGIRVPETVVYEHNFPTDYYYYSNGINKKDRKNLESKMLQDEFQKFEDTQHGIIAQFVSQFEDEQTGKMMSRVEFLDKGGLKDFFSNRKVRERGILQRFITPKGGHNIMIQAIWSPHVVMLERRINVNKLDAISSWTPYERAVTYEGPSHFSQEVFCSPSLKKQIERACESIVNHFENTEHRKISRMVLYFKSDKNGDLWLLYCTSIRIAGNNSKRREPLNLSPRYSSSGQRVDKIFSEFDAVNTMISQSSASGTLHLTGPIKSTAGMKVSKRSASKQEKLQESVSQQGELTEEEKWKLYLKKDPMAEKLSFELDDHFYQVFSFFLTGTNAREKKMRLPPTARSLLRDNPTSVEKILAKFDIYKAEEDEGGALSGEYLVIPGKATGIGPMQHRFKLLCKNLMRLYFQIHGYPDIEETAKLPQDASRSESAKEETVEELPVGANDEIKVIGSDEEVLEEEQQQEEEEEDFEEIEDEGDEDANQ